MNSNSHNHVNAHLAKGIFSVIDGLAPLKSQKDPAVAGIFGFFFGGAGLGLYLQSWLDFILPVAMWVIIAILAAPTAELLFICAPVFTAIYGYRRAKSSNAKLAGPVTVVTTGGAPAAYSHHRIRPVIDLVPAVPPVISQYAQPPATTSNREARLNHLDDLLSQGLLSQSAYVHLRGNIMNEV